MEKAEKIIIGVTAAAAVAATCLAFGVGVGASSAPPPVITAAETSSPAPAAPVSETPPEPDRGQIFDQLVGAKLGYAAVDAARGVAQAFCDSLGNGTSFGDASMLMLAIGQQEGVTPTQLGTIIGAGVPAFCPEYSDDMQRWSESQP